MATEQKYAIIVAGGKGLRMGTDIPKQFLELEGRPVLFHTIEAFHKADPNTKIILVLPKQHIQFWKDLTIQYSFNLSLDVVVGGNTRFQSVNNGLKATDETDGLVAIHDGVRPLIAPKIINNAYLDASIYGSAVVAVPSKDSLRVRQGNTTKAVNRSDYFLVQTPQTFNLKALKEAFKTEEKPFFTDDASVFEHAGGEIHLIDGSYQNIKITTMEDLAIARVMISNRD